MDVKDVLAQMRAMLAEEATGTSWYLYAIECEAEDRMLQASDGYREAEQRWAEEKHKLRVLRLSCPLLQ